MGDGRRAYTTCDLSMWCHVSGPSVFEDWQAIEHLQLKLSVIKFQTRLDPDQPLHLGGAAGGGNGEGDVWGDVER